MVQLGQRLHGALVRRPWLASVAVAVVGAAVLLWRLDRPDGIIFDEVYYVGDARGFLDTGVEPGFAVHPPLGKWFIALGIAVAGDTPVGWRVVGALAGVVTLVCTHLLAGRLLRDRADGWWLALVAPLLLLADGLFLTQSRIAMLDVFLVALATAGLLVLVVDHQRRLAGHVRPGRVSLRLLAGALFGLALSVKWSGLLAIGVGGLLTIGWELAAAFHDPLLGGRWRELPRRAVMVVGSLVLVPAAVYAATWVPWLVNYEDTHTAGCGVAAAECDTDLGDRLAGLVRHHDAIAGFHLGLEASHTYRSDPVGWLLLARPVVYHWDTCTAEQAATEPTLDPETGELTGGCDIPLGTAAEVLSIGNPALWWGFVLASPLLLAGALRRDRRSAVVVVGVLGTWLPWLAVSRTAFLFYLAPAVPLLAIGLVLAAVRLGRPARRLWTYVGAAGGAALLAGATAVARLTVVGIAGRWVAIAGLAGWLLGALVGAASDHALERADAIAAGEAGGASAGGDEHPTDRDRVRTRRWLVAITLVVLATAVWFAPVWFAAPIDADAVRLRWWFDSWI